MRQARERLVSAEVKVWPLTHRKIHWKLQVQLNNLLSDCSVSSSTNLISRSQLGRGQYLKAANWISGGSCKSARLFLPPSPPVLNILFHC